MKEPAKKTETVIEEFVPPPTKPEPAPANKIIETKPLIIAKPEPLVREPVVSGIPARTIAEQAAGRRSLRK